MARKTLKSSPVFGIAAALFIACSGGDGCSGNDPRPGTSDCQECDIGVAADNFESCFSTCYSGCDELLVSEDCAGPLPNSAACAAPSDDRTIACECLDCLTCIDECDGCPGDSSCLGELNAAVDTEQGRCGLEGFIGLDCGDGIYTSALPFDAGFDLPQPATKDCDPCNAIAVDEEVSSCLSRCSPDNCGSLPVALLFRLLPVVQDDQNPCDVDPTSVDCEERLCLECVDECLGCGVGASCLGCGGSCDLAEGVCSTTRLGDCREGDLRVCQRPLRCGGTVFRLDPIVADALNSLVF